MPLLYLETVINAPQQVVFDLSRSVDLHKASMTHHKEEIIAGVRKGLMNGGDTVTWRAKHLFLYRTLKVKLTECNPPIFFADEMLEGDFKTMRHEHFFKAMNGGTLMIDKFYFESPFGTVGKIFNALFLKGYMNRLLCERNKEVKRIAEGSLHNRFLS